MKGTMRKAFLVIVLVIFQTACALVYRVAPMLAPTPTSTPTFTSTATSTASLTPSPSATPQPTATDTPAPPTATMPTLPPTRTATPFTPSPTPGPLACALIWQSPPDDAEFSPFEFFGTGWNIKNTGTLTWQQGSVEGVYIGGAQLHNDPVATLNTSVGPGQEVVVSVHMWAPRNPGRYTTHWSLRMGGTYFCRLTLSIKVVE